jgi:DNA polymerase III alpha subunit
MSIKPIGYTETLDIEIESEDHIFFANGIATSNSHSVSYGITSYWSAYTKKTKPLEFYREWLAASDRKLDPHAEVRNLVISARHDSIEIIPPSAKYMTSEFFIKENRVHFGLTHVKGVSAHELDQLWSLLSEYGVMIHPTQLLVNVLPQINKRTCEALIRVGAFDYLGIPRTKLLHYYTCVYLFTKTELKFFKDCTEDLADVVNLALATKKEGGAAASVTRLEKLKSIAQMIKNPGRSLDDTPIMIATTEEELIGIPLSCSYMDSCLNATNADTTCREFKRGKSGKMSLAVRVKEVKEHLMKDGESKMAFLTVEDDTAEISDVVIFKEEYKNFGRFLYVGAFVGIIGEKGKKNSLVVSRIVEL